MAVRWASSSLPLFNDFSSFKISSITASKENNELIDLSFIFAEKDALEIYVDGEQIILKKYEPACIFCGDARDVVNYKGKNICKNCLNELKTDNK